MYRTESNSTARPHEIEELAIKASANASEDEDEKEKEKEKEPTIGEMTSP